MVTYVGQAVSFGYTHPHTVGCDPKAKIFTLSILNLHL